MSNELAPLGHNNPPEVTEIMAQEQIELYADKLKEIERMIEKESNVPPEINDDDDSGKASDFIKLAKATVKEAENIRMAEKKKYTVKSDAIQSFWKKRLTPVEDAIGRVQTRLAPYLKAKEDQKRREAEEKARIAKEKADKALRDAQEKERQEREAKEAAERELKRVEEENARKLKEQQEEAERKRKEAEAEAKRIADAAAAKLKAAQNEIDRMKKEKADAEKAAQEKVLKDEADAKADAERKQREKDAEARLKEATKDVKVAAREGNELLKETEKEIRQDAKDVRTEMREAEDNFADLHKESKDATRDKNRALDEAVRADKEHQRAVKGTLAGSAELSRTRGDGSVSSIREEYTGEVADRDKLDLEALRDHIPFEALNQAVRSWVKANDANRQLRGAMIYQQTMTMVR